MNTTPQHDDGPADEKSYWTASVQRDPSFAIPDGPPGRWWVAHTKPRQEKALARNLDAFRIFYYLPLAFRTTRSRRTGRRSTSTVPVFPSYLFFRATEQERHQSLTTNRIANTLAVMDQAELVHQLRQIQQLLAAGHEYRWHGSLEVGDLARIETGPFAGLEGVVRTRRPRRRLILNVDMLGQSVSVEIAQSDLVRIEAPSPRNASP